MAGEMSSHRTWSLPTLLFTKSFVYLSDGLSHLLTHTLSSSVNVYIASNSLFTPPLHIPSGKNMFYVSMGTPQGFVIITRT